MIVMKYNPFAELSDIFYQNDTTKEIERAKISSKPEYFAKLAVDWCNTYEEHELKLDAPSYMFDELNNLIVQEETKNYRTNWIKVVKV